MPILKESGLAALAAAALGVAIVGLRIDEQGNALTVVPRFGALGAAVGLVFLGRLGIGLVRAGGARWTLPAGLAVAAAAWATGLPSAFLTVVATGGGLVVAAWAGIDLVRRRRPAPSAATLERRAHRARRAQAWFVPVVIAFALALPSFPFADRRLMDIAILVMTYVMLGWGLNIVVGLAGLLDLGYVAFYAVGAYSFALFAQDFHLGFWACLPLAGALAASFGIALGFPVLRLRGDYLAIVTLGFGEMIRIVLTNWVSLTNGPNGIAGIPRPDFFGVTFFPVARHGGTTFHQLFGVPYSPMQRIVFLYYVILAMALLTNFVTLRLRRLPIGRAWEALREDEIACRALGINPTAVKLSAFAMGATFGGLAGAFFATRQGFISPESFTFIESAIILAIVVLGGMGSQTGVALAAFLLIGIPEWFRALQEYRMLAFGVSMVLIMTWRPRGLLAHREPTIRLAGRKAGP